jgi:hypothetical protein
MLNSTTPVSQQPAAATASLSRHALLQGPARLESAWLHQLFLFFKHRRIPLTRIDLSPDLDASCQSGWLVLGVRLRDEPLDVLETDLRDYLRVLGETNVSAWRVQPAARG